MVKLYVCRKGGRQSFRRMQRAGTVRRLLKTQGRVAACLACGGLAFSGITVRAMAANGVSSRAAHGAAASRTRLPDAGLGIATLGDDRTVPTPSNPRAVTTGDCEQFSESYDSRLNGIQLKGAPFVGALIRAIRHAGPSRTTVRRYGSRTYVTGLYYAKVSGQRKLGTYQFEVEYVGRQPTARTIQSFLVIEYSGIIKDDLGAPGGSDIYYFAMLPPDGSGDPWTVIVDYGRGVRSGFELDAGGDKTYIGDLPLVPVLLSGLSSQLVEVADAARRHAPVRNVPVLPALKADRACLSSS